MSKKQYEDFLVELFFDWAISHLEIGEKLHFKSQDDNNSLRLYEAFLYRYTSSFLLENHDINYISLNNFKVIPVLHSELDFGYSENYISRLRDLVSSQKGDFKNSVLLIIHNSSLDTLNNSSRDLTLRDNVWNPKNIYQALINFINESYFKDYQISKQLLKHQFEIILSDGATMFGFREIFNAIRDGKIEFNELGYLNDSVLESWSESNISQIENRLNENKKLKENIEYIVEQFPTDYVEKLVDLDFSEKFIDKYFSKDDLESWKINLDFGECQQEREINSIDFIEFSALLPSVKSHYHRTRGDSSQKGSAAFRDHHLIVEVPRFTSLININITFIKGQLFEDDIKIAKKFKKITNFKINKRSNKKAILDVEIYFTGEVSYLDFEIKRPKPKECFKFKILLIPENIFPIHSFANNFLLVPSKEQLILATDKTILSFDSNKPTYTLSQCGELIDINDFGTVDFNNLFNTEEQVGFVLKNDDKVLKFEVQGILSVSSLSLPLIFNTEKYHDLFNDQIFGHYNAKNLRISFLGREYKVRNEYRNLLEIETQLIQEKLLSNKTSFGNQITLNDVCSIYPDLGNTYLNLYNYLEQKGTLISLVSWGNEFTSIVQSVINEYVKLINEIPTERMLSASAKLLVNLGFYSIDECEYLSPIHPLNLSYFLNLARKCCEDQTDSFKTLPTTTMRRLNAEGLLPFNWHIEHQFSYSQVLNEHPMWIKIVPKKLTQLDYIRPLVRQKTNEFIEAFKILFNQGARDTLIINSIHNEFNQELFLGLVDFVQRFKLQDVPQIHINLYDDELVNTYFDVVADVASQAYLKKLCQLSLKDQNSDQIVDVIRRRITYSKFEITNNIKFKYAHLTFIRNNTPVEVANVDLRAEKTGIACGGLLAGETSYHQENTYFTTAGLRGIDHHNNPAIQIVQRYSALSHAAWNNQKFYESNGLALKVSNKLQLLLDSAYEDSLWTVIIDPKVTLDFFKAQQDIVLIHYSDNYTNSAHYDAITVTKRRDLYDQILSQGQAGRIDEFNAFNGEWLLKMLTMQEKDRREKKSIIAAYKYVNCLLFDSDITWVPLSIAEMIRVSGNIGLKMGESDFSTYCQGKKYGVISDDVLFVGFKDEQMYLLPLEVKVGQKQKHDKGVLQAKKLKQYLENCLFGKRDLASHLYRGLFIRQIMMQVEKYQLYQTDVC
ncbi:DNA phosphorothioation-dependent restriction protein DptH [Acinetobacter sp. 105-3]|uniref:DNA phosphorothioation-dependent restriction protein DptH n=1 Tax=Acinetobacter sp. 105-3 TaxID=2686015 RepID=UPI00195A9A10|nr:DNA phosphorothioation-dependent restriction protein DptH [Acinetobacter sp. 105-3]MBM7142472.1 DNA phosphorothioation-dependent restriction protein DptH [Acinetobacter sp. 105-3]